MRFGDTLRQRREEHGIGLEDIAVATRVSVRNLEALEAERFQDLPGGIFNRGIVRSYARVCGMDEEAAVSAYAEAMRERGLSTEDTSDGWTTFAENVRRNRVQVTPPRRVKWAAVLAMVLGVFLLAGGVYLLLARRHLVPLPARVQNRVDRLGNAPAGSSQARPAP